MLMGLRASLYYCNGYSKKSVLTGRRQDDAVGAAGIAPGMLTPS